jgi:hypothetical protein
MAALCASLSVQTAAAKVQRAGHSRSCHPAYAAYARLEKVPRKSPEKPVGNAKRQSRISWSGKCAYAEARGEPLDLVAGAGFEPATSGL